MKLYLVHHINKVIKVNNWLLECSKVSSFKAISISISYGCGAWNTILFSIDGKDLEKLKTFTNLEI